MADTRILLKKSGVKGKLPSAADAQYGELFVNYHSGDPMLCFKDNAGEIVQIKPTKIIDGGGGEVPPTTDVEIGDTLWDGTHLLLWDGSEWIQIGPQDFWNRTGTTLSPVNAGDNVTIDGLLKLQDDSSPYIYLERTGAGRHDGAIGMTDDACISFRVSPNPSSKDWNDLIERARFDDAGSLLIGGTLPAAPNITLNAGGSGEFASFVKSGSTAWSALNPGYVVVQKADAAYGDVLLQLRKSSTDRLWEVRGDGTTWIGGTLTGVESTSSPNITLSADGSATFAGNIQQDLSGTNPGNLFYSTGGLYSRVAAESDIVYQVNVGTSNNFRILGSGVTYIGAGLDLTASNANITLSAADGNVIAKRFEAVSPGVGTLYFNSPVFQIQTDGTTKIAGTLPSAPNITLNADGSASFAGLVDTGGVRAVNANGIAYLASSSIYGLSLHDSNDDPKTQLGWDGSATFANRVNVGSSTLAGNYAITAYNNDDNTSGSIRSTIFAQNFGTGLVWQGYDATQETSRITSSGSAEFAGSVLAKNAFGAILSDANKGTALLGGFNSASGTTEEYAFAHVLGNNTLASAIRLDGSAEFAGDITANNVTFNAGTPEEFSAKERLVAARETFQELRLAVQDADNFESLRQAMLVALDRWSPANSAAFS